MGHSIAMRDGVSGKALDDRVALVDRYRSIRARSAALFQLVTEEAYYDRPIALRNPIVFYEGHLPAFSVNTLVRKALGRRGIDEQLEVLFARGIDPDTEASLPDTTDLWPTREDVLAYGAAADALVIDILSREELIRPGSALLRDGEAVFTILEHELMHQETLLYLFHQLPFEKKRRPSVPREPDLRAASERLCIEVPSGRVRLGKPRSAGFGWDNEFEGGPVDVPRFSIDSRSVTNAEFLAFIDAGGYSNHQLWSAADWNWISEAGTKAPVFWRQGESGWMWRGMFEESPLPESWPVWVSQAEASAYARWMGGRLPTEAELEHAGYFDPAGEERAHPWGNAPATAERGNFDFQQFDPEPAGLRPAGQSALGIRELVGNGWEWTSSVFGPLHGFAPMPSYPEYSADFFDGRHFVMKGASPVTSAALVRKSFRNWFRPHYPYVYAKFRCVSEKA